MTRAREQSKANRALIRDYLRVARDAEPKCPNCGHWMRWSERLDLWLCAWCKTKLATDDRSMVARVVPFPSGKERQ